MLFASLLLFGTVGFYVVDRFDAEEGARSLADSFYFTLVVLTTVGMDGPVSQLERYFSIVLMLVGIFLAAAAASNLVAFAIDGELNKHFGRRRLEKMLRKQEAHFIVVGFGRMGRALCQQMAEKKEAFVLIERSPTLAEEAQAMDYLVVEGDATDESTLRRAGIADATGLATCLPSDPANVFVTLTARGLRPYMDIVSRAEDPLTEAKLLRAGATRVICPPVVGARRLREMLIKPMVVDLIPDTSAEAESLDVCTCRVDSLPGLMGKTLGETQFKETTGMLVAAVERNGTKTFEPSDDFILSDTDKLFTIGPDGGAERIMDAFGPKDRPKLRPKPR